MNTNSLSALKFLEEAARDYPHKCAVIHENESCSYKELLELSKAAGCAFLKEIIQPNQGVLLIAYKSIKSLGAMFGAHFACTFYAPLDPDSPASRIAAVYDALGTPLVVVDSEGAHKVATALPKAKVITLDALFEGDISSVQAAPTSPEAPAPSPLDPAYVMFTSGSTGTPKGVVVSHESVTGFINSFVDTFSISESDIIANQAPLDFDVSVKDIYGALAAKATLLLIPRQMFLKPLDLVAYLEQNRATIMTWAVAALCMITSFHALTKDSLPTVKKVLFSGEVMPLDHLREWMDCLSSATFVNLYGPTEVTCNCTYHVLDRTRNYSDGIPLGLPFPGRTVVLQDEGGASITTPGVQGEIVVSGSFLASGYLGASPKDNESFAGVCGLERLRPPYYKTGDLGSYNAKGELIYAGRKDNQIKHMGHRIELEEIEAAIETWEKVRRCRCVYYAKKKRIVAFLEGEATDAEIRQHVKNNLMFAMRPARCLRVESMPLNKNGKVDRAALMKEVVAIYE